MKKLLFIGVLLSLLHLSSCTPDTPEVQPINLEITYELSGDAINFHYSLPDSEPSVVLAVGCIEENELMDMGMLEGLSDYIQSQIDAGTATIVETLPYTLVCEGLDFSCTYYAYAIQVKDGKAVGDISLSNPVLLRNVGNYFMYTPKYIVVAPKAISGNGIYVCGSDDQKYSFVLDLRTGEAVDVDGINLKDIDNNGNAYGDAGFRAAVYENGEVKILDESKTGTLFACTSDGSKAVGYWGYKHAAVYEGGKLDTLLSEAACLTGPYDPTDPDDWYAPDGPMVTSGIETGTAMSISENGIVTGWFQDDIWSIELSCWWDLNGDLHMIGIDKVEYMPEERWFRNVYGGRDTKVSPNGKHIAGNGPFGVFMIDAETGVHTDLDGIMGGEICAVSNTGNIYMSGGMIYSAERGLESLEDYLSAVHGVQIYPSMAEVGTLVSVSDDEKVFVFCHQDMASLMFTTHVYSF